MGQESVLIVDDNPDNLTLTEIILETEGYQLRSAEDAESALKALENFHPNLILMDVQLPGMDGLELTRILRSDDRFSGIKVVALTAYAMKGDAEAALAAGCDGYITKPIDTRTFADTVRMYLSAA